jgi:hypothetical protein
LAVIGAGAKNSADRGVMRGAEGVLDAAAGFVRPQTMTSPAVGAIGSAAVPAIEDAQSQFRNR